MGPDDCGSSNAGARTPRDWAPACAPERPWFSTSSPGPPVGGEPGSRQPDGISDAVRRARWRAWRGPVGVGGVSRARAGDGGRAARPPTPTGTSRARRRRYVRLGVTQIPPCSGQRVGRASGAAVLAAGATAAPTAARGRGEQDRYETTRGDHGWVLRRLMGVGGSAGARELGGAEPTGAEPVHRAVAAPDGEVEARLSAYRSRCMRRASPRRPCARRDRAARKRLPEVNGGAANPEGRARRCRARAQRPTRASPPPSIAAARSRTAGRTRGRPIAQPPAGRLNPVSREHRVACRTFWPPRTVTAFTPSRV